MARAFLALLLFTATAGTPAVAADATLHPETIAEGKAAAQEALDKTGADSISLAVVDNDHIAWQETFGVANQETGAAPTADTLYCIGSTSKMFAAVAVMKLVDQGKLALDSPVALYLPSFRMQSPESKNITVRMLLNHTSGLPGTDNRNFKTSSPYPRYAKDVQQDLREQSLIYPPGYLAVYTNNGFTLAEDLVSAVSGKSYPDFVRDEIFAPLGMTRSRFSTEVFPADTFAHSSFSSPADPLEYVNAYGAGGLYTTPSDMARFAMMLLHQGAVGSTRILSPRSVAAMATDQVKGTFDPVPDQRFRFGLGWDTVQEPGLAAAGRWAWTKGGDTSVYGASLIVDPEDGLATIVIGIVPVKDSVANSIGERILLRELVARGTIPEMPPSLAEAPLPPAAEATPGQLQAISGYWATKGGVIRIESLPDGTLQVSNWSGKTWVPDPAKLKLRRDGWFGSDEEPGTELKAVSGGGRDYLAQRMTGGYGEYRYQSAYAQRVSAQGPLSPAWQKRVGQTWLVVNQTPDLPVWQDRISTEPPISEPRLSLAAIPGLDGIIGVTSPAPEPPQAEDEPAEGPQPAIGSIDILDATQSGQSARPMLLIPTLAGRDQTSVDILPRPNGEEWVREAGLVYRPLATVPRITAGQSASARIGPEAYGEWRALQTHGAAATLQLNTHGAWRLYGADFKLLSSGAGNSTVEIPAGTDPAYVLVYGAPGESVALALR